MTAPRPEYLMRVVHKSGYCEGWKPVNRYLIGPIMDLFVAMGAYDQILSIEWKNKIIPRGSVKHDRVDR